MTEWKLSEKDIIKILNTPASGMQPTEQRLKELEKARKILDNWKENK